MQEKLEVHIGTLRPEEWAKRASMPVRHGLPRPTGPQIVTDEIPWPSMGLLPRWVGDDPSNAVAALEASELLGNDWVRFQLGAETRGEAALYISTTTPHRPMKGDWSDILSGFAAHAREIELPHQHLYELPPLKVLGQPIELSRAPALGDDLSPTDRDLALRILNAPGAQWRAIDVDDDPEEDDTASFGEWTPLLVTPDGLTVAAVWTDAGEYDTPTYHYLVPRLQTYDPILQWLTDRAVPDLIPTAAARTRSYIADQPELQSSRERDLTDQITTLTDRYEQAKDELQQALAAERIAVSAVRDPLLFGSGAELDKAVAKVLVDAGVTVTPLDDILGTVSADLLVEYAGRRLLVEVKSVGGNAPESLAEAPHRHLRTWPAVGTGQPVAGVVLVVNHQHKRPPASRALAVFGRREFVDTLDFPVVATLALFDLWRQGDTAGVRQMFGLEGPAAQT
ncbi:hypothetical protein [Promicromonospora sp. NFX87]|uniref:hypothetical protein n=1 Tax=Promicromonospora sp. NFX87 TaxID=3402691 RepID=UPI003AFAB843